MKKKIRSEIAKLARQIISEEAFFNASQLKSKVVQLHEQLTVLNYLESQVEDALGTIEPQALDSKSFREENWFTEPEPLPESQNKEELVEPLMEKIKDIVAQMPQESQHVDEMLKEVLPSPTNEEERKYIKNELEEFASNYQQTPIFERKEVKAPSAEATEKINNTNGNSADAKTKSINDSVNKGLNIGLNDRLAFVKHLFDDKTEDYTRVLSQIGTMNTYQEAESFIQGMIKPDYDNWLHKEAYSNRFMDIIEKSFN